jgi:mono/diheme cytochrome c family protein
MKKIIWAWGITFILLTASQQLALADNTNSGKRMYLQYCSSCHGNDGKGNGAVSPFLKIKLPDLTQLAKNNRGIYPLEDVMAAIDGRRAVPAHGDRHMPVWGEVFGKEFEEGRYPELSTLLKAKIIAEYIATIQNKPGKSGTSSPQ